MKSKDDLVRVLDAARNVVVDGKIPLVFLDEFDSRRSHYPLLLPLLWDGELDVGNRDLRVGRSVFFLAGSRPSLPERLAAAREMFASRAEGPDEDKTLDLFSRINGGVIEVPSLAGESSAAEKVVIAMHLLRARFKKSKMVPRSLLFFVSKVTFRYEARSIATLVNMIRGGPENLDSLPFRDPRDLKESPLAFHLLHEDGARGLSDLWRESTDIAGGQQIRDEFLEEEELGTRAWADVAWSYLALVPEAPPAPLAAE